MNANNKQLKEISNNYFSLLHSSLLYNSSQDIWINLDDRKESEMFVWGDGDDLLWHHWSNWETGQPNNFWSEEYKEQQSCVELEPSFNLQWNDELCSFKNAYICQKEKGGSLWKPFFFRKIGFLFFLNNQETSFYIIENPWTIARLLLIRAFEN